MLLKSFTISVITRVILLLATITGLSFIFGRAELFFNQIILAILLIIQVYALIRYVNRTNQDLAKFLLSIKNADFTVHFPHRNKDRTFRDLHAAFREIIEAYKEVKADREVQYQYLKLIVKHIKAGIISLKGDEEIALINQQAMSMLQISQYHYWRNLKLKHPRFASEVEQLKEGESKLIDIPVNGEHKKLSVHTTSIVLLRQPYKIITFQDIENEINQSEVDAWHKLIRILTHEIMNSVTPISSLTETMLMLIQDEKGVTKNKEEIQDAFLTDLAFSLQTIQKRSDGLLHFLDDYRKLTKVPTPRTEKFSVKKLFDTVSRLMLGEFTKRNIQFKVSITPEELMLHADFSLIEQVLINLLTNGMQALQAIQTPLLILAAWQQNDKTIIEVTDNGAGIDEDKLDKIFVPFYSTKDNGSGIGLSLSRHIMNLHGGTIRVNSQKGHHTSFYLSFQKVAENFHEAV